MQPFCWLLSTLIFVACFTRLLYWHKTEIFEKAVLSLGFQVSIFHFWPWWTLKQKNLLYLFGVAKSFWNFRNQKNRSHWFCLAWLLTLKCLISFEFLNHTFDFLLSSFQFDLFQARSLETGLTFHTLPQEYFHQYWYPWLYQTLKN